MRSAHRGGPQRGKFCNHLVIAISMPDSNAVLDGNGGNQAVGRRAEGVPLTSVEPVDFGGRYKQVEG